MEHVCGFSWGIKDVKASSSLQLLSLGLLVRLRLGEVTGQRRVVAIPQLVQLGGLVLAAAGAAVPETGQGGTQLGALGGHGALDGLPELRREGRERREAWVSAPPEQEPPSSTWGGTGGGHCSADEGFGCPACCGKKTRRCNHVPRP